MGTWFDDPTIIPYLEERLKLGVHRGIGEFHLYGESANSAVIGQMIDLARRDKLLLHAHPDQRRRNPLRARPRPSASSGRTPATPNPPPCGRWSNATLLLVETAIRSDMIGPAAASAPPGATSSWPTPTAS
ncbi:MAG: hypothetical protein U0841_30680 [Chloroflexia bacterium]